VNIVNAEELHRLLKGKIRVIPVLDNIDRQLLSLLYTPGVAEIAVKCAHEPSLTFEYTRRWNTVAVVSDGSAVLGLGNIGAHGALPVMEGKALLFKIFADLDAIPLCLKTHDTELMIQIVKALEPSFGGINLEDIAAPRCFEILKRLERELDIPVFHDDQQGTAVVVCAALKNALKVVGKKLEKIRIVVNGIGAAGYNIVKFLFKMGAGEIVPVDKNGILNPYDPSTCLHEYHMELAKMVNPDGKKGSLQDALKGADVFIGVSRGKLVTPDMVRSMAGDPVVFALANPVPEIDPSLAREAGARIVATGRSDFPNQVNNLLAFPGIMKGAMKARSRITEKMLLAAIEAIANSCEPESERILPEAYDEHVHENVFKAVVSTSNT